jgi:hypothetical protein
MAWARERFRAPTFINGDIADNLWTLANKDTLVAVRVIYYLGGRLDTVFADVAKFIPTRRSVRQRQPRRAVEGRKAGCSARRLQPLRRARGHELLERASRPAARLCASLKL